jgi:hypothetical protein
VSFHQSALTLQTLLLAVTAAVALICAALIAVPSASDATHACLNLGRCLSF